ncbi:MULTISPECIES: hypothetical protein [Sphingobacterium]|uniref:hypothetical protein n=1 Tax=Sphingobacterium TaxID=28453 RepID=UPI0013DA13FA|nr:MULTISPECIES: hypothetical protein [unclassified Sphingobacterium]
MTFEDLQQLFYQGELDLLIEQGEAHIEANPSDLESIILLAVAYHDRVYEKGHEAVYDAIQERLIPYFRKVLQVHPDHQIALYNILDYPLGNQFNLLQVGRIKQHITSDNKSEFLGYADRLIADASNAVYGYDSKVKIYESLEDYTSLIETIDLAITYCQEAFAFNRELRDRNTSIFWMKKVYVLDHTKMISQQELISIIKEGIDRFVSRTEYNYTDLAEMAFEAEAIDLGLTILLKLIKGDNTSSATQEKLVLWHQRFDVLIKNGYNNPRVFYYQLIIERSYPDRVGVAADFYYNHALSLIGLFPENFAGYHFAGTYLFEQGRHEEALPLLEQAVYLGASATAWRRKVIAAYLTDGQTRSDIPEFRDLPRELYNDAIELDDFIMEVELEPDRTALRRLSLALYEQAHEAFRRYFEDNKYKSDYFGGIHNRAMNCNNLAIVQAYFEDYGAAALTAAEGLVYSEFEELHHTLIDALRRGQDFVGLQQALRIYFANYNAEEVSFYKHVQHLASQIEADYELGTSEDIQSEAEQTLYMIYDHHLQSPVISDYDFRDFEAAKNIIEGIIYRLMEDEPIEDRIRYYENTAERYPDEAHAYYVLMQYYNVIEDYARINQAAKSYLEKKRDFLLNDFDRAKTIYMIVKTDYFTERFIEARRLFAQEDANLQGIMEPEDYILWLGYGIKISGKLKDKDQVMLLCNRLDTIYTEQGWSYDQELEDAYLVKALSSYEAGAIKEAHAILDYICSFDDHSELAQTYKRTWRKPGFFAKLGF